MNRMWDKNDIIKLIEEYASGFDPSEIPEGVIDAVLGLNADGEAVKGNLDGKYVRKIPAPVSTVLTEAEYEAFKAGTFINGTFAGFVNPQLFPCGEDSTGTNLVGLLIAHYIGSNKPAGAIYSYKIDKSTRQFSYYTSSYIGFAYNGEDIEMACVSFKLDVGPWCVFRGKNIPQFPTTSAQPRILNLAANSGNGVTGLTWDVNPIVNVAPEYDSTATYSVGALVIHEGLLYQCSTAVTVAEEWDAAKWTQTTLAAVIAAL